MFIWHVPVACTIRLLNLWTHAFKYLLLSVLPADYKAISSDLLLTYTRFSQLDVYDKCKY
jgi:hypothetical protein